MANDRRTGIDGDQITDHTITKDELLIVNDPPSDKMVLGWNEQAQSFKWYYLNEIPSGFNYYEESDGQSVTSSTTWQNKIIYTTPNLTAGDYEFWFQAEIKKGGGAIQRVRMTVDDVEICYNSSDAAFTDWTLASGFKKINFPTSGTHVLKIQYCSGTNNRAIYVRRARTRILSVGV